MSFEVMADDLPDSDETKACKTAQPQRQGLPAYQGYEYQCLATVWLALRVFISRKAKVIVVEPPSEEDAAVELNVPKEDAVSHISIEKRMIQIQIKLRRNSLWKKRSFNALLQAKPVRENGPKPRARPIEFLRNNSNSQYVLLTNADIDTGLTDFEVSEVGKYSKAKKLPCGQNNDRALARRISIIPGKADELLTLAICRVLQEHFHVPGQNQDRCVAELIELVRRRLLGELPRNFSFDEVRETAFRHGGSFPNFEEPVFPSNFALIKEQFYQKNAIILVGPPGTGKTTIAGTLIEELQTAASPSEKFTVNRANQIEAVREAIRNAGNTVFYFEDPWGQENPSADASFFTKELPKLLSGARSGKRFLVTSRMGVHKRAIEGREKLFAPFAITLGPEHYEKEVLESLYRRQLTDWRSGARGRALAWMETALEVLHTPYSVKIFCDRFFEEIRSNTYLSHSQVKKLAEQCNTESFGAVLRDGIVESGSERIASSVALWACLEFFPQPLEMGDVRRMRLLLQKGGLEPPPRVKELFDFLISAQWLQERSSGYVATPSVVEALGEFMNSHSETFEDVLRALIRAWIEECSFVQILAFLKRVPKGKSLVPEAGGDAFDAHLVARVVSDESRTFRYAFSDLSRFSITQIPAAKLARILLERKGKSEWENHLLLDPTVRWIRPELTTQEMQEICKRPTQTI